MFGKLTALASGTLLSNAKLTFELVSTIKLQIKMPKIKLASKNLQECSK